MRRKVTALGVAAVMAAPMAGLARADTLGVGDTAPPIFASQWLNVESAEELAAGSVYVVEMWATWCGPCIAAIPHVNSLYEQHKDDGLVVIGLNVWDDDERAIEFVEQQNERMSYPVAIDDRPDGPQSGKSAEAWLDAAGRSGIPCAFVVDREGRIAWIGHPMAGLEEAVTQLLDEQR